MAPTTSTPNRLRLQVVIATENVQEGQITDLRKFLHITQADRDISTFVNEVNEKFNNLYPAERPIKILQVQDGDGCDLDPTYQLLDVFEERGIARIIISDDGNVPRRLFSSPSSRLVLRETKDHPRRESFDSVTGYATPSVSSLNTGSPILHNQSQQRSGPTTQHDTGNDVQPLPLIEHALSNVPLSQEIAEPVRSVEEPKSRTSPARKRKRLDSVQIPESPEKEPQPKKRATIRKPGSAPDPQPVVEQKIPETPGKDNKRKASSPPTTEPNKRPRNTKKSANVPNEAREEVHQPSVLQAVQKRTPELAKSSSDPEGNHMVKGTGSQEPQERERVVSLAQRAVSETPAKKTRATKKVTKDDVDLSKPVQQPTTPIPASAPVKAPAAIRNAEANDTVDKAPASRHKSADVINKDAIVLPSKSVAQSMKPGQRAVSAVGENFPTTSGSKSSQTSSEEVETSSASTSQSSDSGSSEDSDSEQSSSEESDEESDSEENTDVDSKEDGIVSAKKSSRPTSRPRDLSPIKKQMSPKTVTKSLAKLPKRTEKVISRSASAESESSSSSGSASESEGSHSDSPTSESESLSDDSTAESSETSESESDSDSAESSSSESSRSSSKSRSASAASSANSAKSSIRDESSSSSSQLVARALGGQTSSQKSPGEPFLHRTILSQNTDRSPNSTTLSQQSPLASRNNSKFAKSAALSERLSELRRKLSEPNIKKPINEKTLESDESESDSESSESSSDESDKEINGIPKSKLAGRVPVVNKKKKSGGLRSLFKD